jgi:AraC-like DNA-binding protein
MNKKYLTFNILLQDLSFTENMGSYTFSIWPGCYCGFNKQFITNNAHMHNYYELCLVTSGIGVFTHGNDEYEIRKGSVFVSDPGIAHEIKIFKDPKDNEYKKMSLIFFMFKAEKTDLYTMHSQEQNLNNFISNHRNVVNDQHHLFSYINFITDYSVKSPDNKQPIALALRNFAFESIKALAICPYNPYNKSITTDITLQTSINYIKNNLNRKLYINEIADHCGISVRTLQYRFNKYQGMTIIDFINKEKMNLALDYLSMNYNANQVSEMIGIANPESFSRLFKKYYGLSPKTYKEKNINIP